MERIGSVRVKLRVGAKVGLKVRGSQSALSLGLGKTIGLYKILIEDLITIKVKV